MELGKFPNQIFTGATRGSGILTDLLFYNPGTSYSVMRCIIISDSILSKLQLKIVIDGLHLGMYPFPLPLAQAVAFSISSIS